VLHLLQSYMNSFSIGSLPLPPLSALVTLPPALTLKILCIFPHSIFICVVTVNSSYYTIQQQEGGIGNGDTVFFSEVGN